MANENALLKYSNAVAAVKEHQEASAGVFNAHKELVMKVIDAENELRDAVAESKEGVANATHRVTVVEQTQTVYDEDKIRAALSTNPALLAEAITVHQRPPRITISEIGGE